MEPSKQTFTLNMYEFTYDNSTAKRAATLQIRMRNRYQLVDNEDGEHPSTLFDECSEEVISKPFILLPTVITLLPLRRLCVLNVLAGLNIDGSLCECLGQKIEKYVFRAAETFGHKGFGVVAEVQVTKAFMLYDHKTEQYKKIALEL